MTWCDDPSLGRTWLSMSETKLTAVALSVACSGERDPVGTEAAESESTSLNWREALEAMQVASSASVARHPRLGDRMSCRCDSWGARG